MPTKDKKKQAQWAHEHYVKNKEVVKKRAGAWTNKAKLIARDFTFRVKRRYGCSKCLLKNPIVLDFHHLGNKTDSISVLVAKGWTLESIKKEIRKCVLLCSNCHRIEEHKKRNGGPAWN